MPVALYKRMRPVFSMHEASKVGEMADSNLELCLWPLEDIPVKNYLIQSSCWFSINSWLLSISPLNQAYHAGREDNPFILYLAAKTSWRNAWRQNVCSALCSLTASEINYVFVICSGVMCMPVFVATLVRYKDKLHGAEGRQSKKVIALKDPLTFKQLLTHNLIV